MKKVLLIIPAYNEEDSILNTCNEIKKFKSKYQLDYIVINDGSKDGTLSILKNNNIPHINLICNLGIGGAVQTGYKYAFANDYDVAIQYDADGQHDVKYVDNLADVIIKNNSDFVIGSRYIDMDREGFKSTKARRIGINIISWAIKLRTKSKIYDVTSGFRAANKRVIEYFSKNYPVEYPEPITNMILLKEKYIVNEISVVMRERNAGISSIRAWKNIYYMINVLISILLVSFKDGDINE